MDCATCSTNKLTNRKAIILSSTWAGVGITTFIALTALPTVAAVIPALLSFAACPAMCAAMAGMMLFQRRRTSNRARSKSNEDASQISNIPAQSNVIANAPSSKFAASKYTHLVFCN